MTAVFHVRRLNRLRASGPPRGAVKTKASVSGRTKVARCSSNRRITERATGTLRLEREVLGEGIFLSGTDCEPTWVDEFYIDTFPVTNADYARFCTATGHAPPRHWEGGRCPRPLYDHPVVEVSWRDACAFADWAGKSLPSALQWEKAARGTTGTVFPWGDQKTAAKCNVRETGVGTTTSVSRRFCGAPAASRTTTPASDAHAPLPR
jgi:formylglycine-generating enzyme required for sulfatase activity